MSIRSRAQIVSALLLSLLIVSCQSDRDTRNVPEQVGNPKDILTGTTGPESNEEAEIIAAVEEILTAAGNYNLEDLDHLTSDKAVIGYTMKRDGSWQNKEVTIDEYIKNLEGRELTPYIEIVSDYDILVTEGHMALVRADAVVNRLGIPGLREVNHMILIKEDDQWKLLSIGWTAQEQADEKRKFDIDIFARGYAQAWGSQRPDFVALFFDEAGSLQVNDGDPAIGRAAISDVAQSFMTQFPDMKVSFDSLAHKTGGIEFHWTLTGTDADPKGKGQKVKISGFEFWTLSEENLIKDSKGSFSSEEYNRQLEFGYTP